MKKISGISYVGVLPETQLSDTVGNVTTSVAATITVPTGAYRVVLNGDADFWVNPTTTAAVPSTTVASGGSFFQMKGLRTAYEVTPGDTFSVIPATGTVHVSEEWFQA